jgi:hypothetical protein
MAPLFGIIAGMPHRPPKKSKRSPKTGNTAEDQKRTEQLAENRRASMSAKSSISRFKNFSVERK